MQWLEEVAAGRHPATEVAVEEVEDRLVAVEAVGPQAVARAALEEALQADREALSRQGPLVVLRAKRFSHRPSEYLSEVSRGRLRVDLE